MTKKKESNQTSELLEDFEQALLDLLYSGIKNESEEKLKFILKRHSCLINCVGTDNEKLKRVSKKIDKIRDELKQRKDFFQEKLRLLKVGELMIQVEQLQEDSIMSPSKKLIARIKEVRKQIKRIEKKIPANLEAKLDLRVKKKKDKQRRKNNL